MDSRITIVTAFFYIEREKIANAELARSTKQYFDYFSDWARIKNKMVVYTEKEYVEEVYAIREQYGLRDKTEVIPVADIFSAEKELYEKMDAVSKNQEFRDYRMYVNAMSNDARYDYVMLMKYWCLKDAEERGMIEDMAAWIDFGFNHGGDFFTNPEEFAFLWDYDFSRKIHCFALFDPMHVFSARHMQLQRDCIMGPLIVLPKELCVIFWNQVKDAMDALLWLDCIDDDQQLLLMAYKRYPEFYEIHYSDWFLPLKEYGGAHLTVKEKTVVKKSWKAVLIEWYRKLTGKTIEQQFIKRIKGMVK